MKTLQWAAAALAVGALALPARAETTTTNDWWDVKFESPTPSVSVNNIAYGGTTFTEGKLGALTNNASTAGYDAQVQQNQPWASGYWAMVDGDESYWTNEWYVAEGDMPNFTNSYLKLDTQGNDLTWTPTNSAIELTTLVDADLYLVGSDSPPDTDDFDSAKDVQTAIYLKNEIDEENGETTNSVLCVYVEDALSGNPYWQELKGVELTDNTWAHIQVLVDHTGDPKVSVFVNGTQMSARDGSDIAWTIAHSTSDGAKEHKIHSVAFRGTGAVDNFAGKTLQTSYEEFDFSAEVYMNDELQEVGTVGNVSRLLESVQSGAGKTADFVNFRLTNAANPANPIDVSIALTKIELEDFEHDAVSTYTYSWDTASRQILIDTPSEFINIATNYNQRLQKWVQTGLFSINAPTVGATSNSVIARIYFEDIPEEGTYNAIATTTVGETTTSDAKKVRPSEFAEGATKTITWEFPATKSGGYVLRTVSVQNGATASYADGTATVSVTLSAALLDNTTYANATYVEGDYTGKTPQWIDNGDGSYTLAAGVAKIGTTIYETLASAIAAVEADASTTTTVTLISSVNEDVVIPAGKNVALDLFGNAITNVASDTISVYGTLLLKDSSENTSGIVASAIASKAALVNYPTGSVTIEAGTIAVPDNATYYNIKNMGAMTIEEGAVIVSRVSTKSTLIANGWYGNAAVDRDTTGQPNTAILTINGGVFDGGLNVVKNDDYGILVIEGGTFSNLSQTDAVILNWNETTINGGKFTGVTKILCNGSYGANSADKGVMTINGGTFRANSEQGNLFGYGTEGDKMSDALLEITGGTFYGHVAGLGDNDGTLGVAAISGGSFSEVVPQIYCAEGYVPVTTVDPATGLYTVGKGAVQISIAGEVKTFGSIADAQAAAATAEIADPVFTIINTLSEETVTLAYEDTLKIVVAEDGDATALSVETSEVDNSQYTYVVVSNTDTETGVTTYSVTRTVKTYAVTFTVDGTTVATTNAPYGDTLYGPADPTKTAETGYTVAFAGWTNAVAGGTVVAAADLPAVTGEATWAAVFTTTAIEYTVTVELDGGTLASGDSIPATYTVETAAFTLPTPTKEGFTFKGWVDGDNQPVTQIAGGATGNISLTATWEKDSVEVKVNPGDGLDTIENAPAPIEFTAAGLCKIAFKAPAAGKYVLMTSTTVNGDYKAEGTPVEFAAGALVELTETTAGTTKFFKIGYEK